MATKKKSDLSVLDFVLSPHCRYIGTGLSLVALLLMIIIPMPNYVKTTGRIIHAETQSDSQREGKPGPRKLKYWTNVEYQVDGKEYVAKRFLYTRKPLYAGTDTTIFYDSKNHRDAHLYLPEFSIHNLLLCIFILSGSATGFLFWWNHRTQRKNEENRQATKAAREKVLMAFQVSVNPQVFQAGCPKCEVPIQYQIHLMGQKARCGSCQFLFELPRNYRS